MVRPNVGTTTKAEGEVNRTRRNSGPGAEGPAANVLPPEAVQGAGLNGKILLVEDEAGLVVTLGDRLRKEGYWVEAARDGRQGLDRALNDPFDLIILDLMLPQKSGIDVCRDLRQNGLAVPILMLTARSQTVDKVLGLKIGADDYVTKPFDMLELLARVEALLRRAPSTPASLGPFIRSVRFELTCDAPRYGAIGSLSLCQLANSSCYATSSSTEALRSLAANCLSKCGGTAPQQARAPSMFTWQDCARSLRATPSSLG